MKTSLACTLIAVLLATAACPAAVLVSTVDDFSTAAQGTNGLQYGYYTSADQTTGAFSTANMSVVSGSWVGTEAFGTPVFTAAIQHPGASTLYPAVRRYTVGSGGETAYSGLVQIMGQFGGGPAEGGGSVIGFVTVDGVTLFSAPANISTTVNFDFQTTVSPGSQIDFGVMANGDPGFDTTFFAATVLSVPEPSKSLLLLAGCLGVSVRRRRPACQ
jgi:hypothetical protein